VRVALWIDDPRRHAWVSGAWLMWAIAGTALVCAFAALRAGIAGLPGDPVCWLKLVTHVSCPTCGLTRSLERLAGGDLAGSLELHPWGALLVAQITVGWLAWALWNARGLRVRPDRWLPHAALVNALALTAFWLGRLLAGTLP